jgi:hypothetical protein
MEVTARSYALNAVLAFAPDLLVAWAASKLTESGWQGFLITLLVLQCIYFFFWAKQAAWSWLLFWIYGKEQMASFLQRFFAENRFPAPSAHAKDFDDYLVEMIGNPALDPSIRIKAAYEAGTLNGFKTCRRYSLVMQLNSAASLAQRRYTRTASPAPATDDVSEVNGARTLGMRHEDLLTVAWLADYGFRVWTYSADNVFRFGDQLSQDRAEQLAALLDQFERRIVPDLFNEPAEDKTNRFDQHENRLKTIWENYPPQHVERGPWTHGA